jgi:predicted dinucleotide-utilizing enzyme
MEKQNIAIIGLGRIGSAFLGEMLRKKGGGINLAYAAEQMDTQGKVQAIAAGINIVALDDIVALGDRIDVIFELTGLPDVRKELREKLTASNNRHTVIASETVVRVIWALISDNALPVIEGRKTGY